MEFQFDPKRVKKLSPDEQRQLTSLLEELSRSKSSNPLAFYNLPGGPHPVHGKQLVFHQSRDRIKAFLGGNRSGKTTAGICDDLIQAVDIDVLPEHLRPFKKWGPGSEQNEPFYCRIMTPDLSGQLDGVILQKFREWCPKGQLYGNGLDKAFDKQLRKIQFKNGSWFQIMSYDQDVDKMGGAALHRVHFDEEPPKRVFDENWMRLVDYNGDVLLTMTPLQGLSWTFHDVWERREEPGITVVTVDMDDNPHLPEQSKREVLARYSKDELDARKRGNFVHFAGMIYPEFKKRRHVVPDRDAEWDVYVGIDPGIRHMNAVVWVEQDPDGKMTVLHELAVKDAPIADICKAILETNIALGVIPRWYVIDPAARNRNNQTGRSDQMEFADHGVVTIPGQNSVSAGIHRVKMLLERDKLEICSSCDVLVGQMERYRWRTAKQKSENEAPEQPVKADDHLLDALRYVIMSRPIQPVLEEKDDMNPMLKFDLEQAARPRVESGFGPGIYQ